MRFALIAIAAVSLLAPSLAEADSFAPPTLAETRSPSGAAMVTTIPAMLSCAPGETGCTPAARAIVENVSGDTRYAASVIRLVNDQAPGLTLVTDDGARVLTVNDYAGAGFGPNVLVIYRRDGSVVRRIALEDIVPKDYAAGLPRTASTIRWWAEEPSIEQGSHIAIVSLNLVGPESQSTRGTRALPLRLDLDTGAIEAPSGPAWENARNCARAQSWLVPDRKAARERERFRKLCR